MQLYLGCMYSFAFFFFFFQFCFFIALILFLYWNFDLVKWITAKRKLLFMFFKSLSNMEKIKAENIFCQIKSEKTYQVMLKYI